MTMTYPHSETTVGHLMSPEEAEDILDNHGKELLPCYHRILSGLASMSSSYEVPSRSLSVVYDNLDQVDDDRRIINGIHTLYRKSSRLVSHKEDKIRYEDFFPGNIIFPDQAKAVADIYRRESHPVPENIFHALDTISMMEDVYLVESYKDDIPASSVYVDSSLEAFMMARDILAQGYDVQTTVEFHHHF